MELYAFSADELFDKVIYELMKTDDKELINANLCLLKPTENMMSKKRNMSIKYAVAEHLWYESKNTNVKSISPYSKFWEKISDDGTHVNSNYGYCIYEKFGFDQWDFVKNLLIKEPNSRRAVIHIKEPRNLFDSPTKDLNCTLSLQFILRNNKLDLITTMRSNDVWLGLPYDVFNFTCLQMRMAMELNVEVGVYYHNAGSLHLYERDVEKVRKLYDNLG